jgi:O-antigen ligase
MWVAALIVVLGVAVASALIGGRFRFRFSLIDVLIVAMATIIALSANHAVDRRPAINLAWEWVAVAIFYLLYRNLPRTRAESQALAGAIVAAAFAVSCYGIYQVKVELPLMQSQYLRDPLQSLAAAGVSPGGHGEQMFRNRLLGSNEPWSTFGLPGSLAGFIVGPLVIALGVGLDNLVQRGGRGSRWSALLLGAPVAFVILLCLIWTKARSSWIGLAVALAVLAWRARGRVPARVLAGITAAGLALIGVLIAASYATGRLDAQVLTQSRMSLGYRWEYWQGAWGVITGGASSLRGIWNSPVFWSGVGPGNFGGPYLLHKLPQASEEILDPHNALLEVWAAGGVWAFLAMVGASIGGLWVLLRSTASAPADADPRELSLEFPTLADSDLAGLDGSPPPANAAWLVAAAGVGWVLVVAFNGLNPFVGDLFFRWLILGACGVIAVLLGASLWRRVPVSAPFIGAGALAVMINLLAAGGIGIPTVALAFWAMLAIGLNLADNRRSAALHDLDTRMPSLGLMFVWAALLGSFLGAVRPYWRAEAAIASAEEALLRKPPELEGAIRAYEAAAAADRYYSRPWLGLASVQNQVWELRGAKYEDKRWEMIPILLEEAAKPPRNPNSWSLHHERALAINRLIGQLGSRLTPREMIRYRGALVEALRRACLLHPTYAELHAELAEASAAISMINDASEEATEALRLDRITPHLDKKLPDAVRARLEAALPGWSEAAAGMKMPTVP